MKKLLLMVVASLGFVCPDLGRAMSCADTLQACGRLAGLTPDQFARAAPDLRRLSGQMHRVAKSTFGMANRSVSVAEAIRSESPQLEKRLQYSVMLAINSLLDETFDPSHCPNALKSRVLWGAESPGVVVLLFPDIAEQAAIAAHLAAERNRYLAMPRIVYGGAAAPIDYPALAPEINVLRYAEPSDPFPFIPPTAAQRNLPTRLSVDRVHFQTSDFFFFGFPTDGNSLALGRQVVKKFAYEGFRENRVAALHFSMPFIRWGQGNLQSFAHQACAGRRDCVRDRLQRLADDLVAEPDVPFRNDLKLSQVTEKSDGNEYAFTYMREDRNLLLLTFHEEFGNGE